MAVCDREIWIYTRKLGAVLVTKDEDSMARSLADSAVWLRMGNTTDGRHWNRFQLYLLPLLNGASWPVQNDRDSLSCMTAENRPMIDCNSDMSWVIIVFS